MNILPPQDSTSPEGSHTCNLALSGTSKSHNIEVYPIHSLAEKKCGAVHAAMWLSGESTTSFQDAPSYTNSNPANAKGLETEGGRLDGPDADS
ncbi:hypothetical protein CFIO01_06603 [Colletotrichum fioriniae PJ7]|uniref:Uncharacterized protein n=1 Tax=Colletotrichum fioriniae PJ7 TaxID=1445577 RepID=A0A010R7P0_9PEZI|nr:hypothetical protein CFIO01_06603 [Colletotrichum fioriniae PJ7]